MRTNEAGGTSDQNGASHADNLLSGLSHGEIFHAQFSHGKEHAEF
jgi:hypothetical protein